VAIATGNPHKDTTMISMNAINLNYAIGSEAILLSRRPTGANVRCTVIKHYKDGGMLILTDAGREIRITARGDQYGAGLGYSSPRVAMDPADGERLFEIKEAKRKSATALEQLRTEIFHLDNELKKLHPDMAKVTEMVQKISDTAKAAVQ
jgi:hypothetical protein